MKLLLTTRVDTFVRNDRYTKFKSLRQTEET